MSPRRPPRAWVGSPRVVDPAELSGPRGLTGELLQEELGKEPGEDLGRQPSESDARVDFFWSLLSEARRARIEAVVDARLASVTCVLDRLLDPHNTAAILRTAEGLGLARVHLVPYEPEAEGSAHRRVTRDAEKWLELEVHPSGAACARALAGQGFTVLAGHLAPDARPDFELPADRPLALLFGNEHEGPSPETLAACQGTFVIPMAGFTQSFNVSVAAAIALAGAVRARRAHLGRPGDLTAAEREALRRRFTLLAQKLSRRLKSPPSNPSKE